MQTAASPHRRREFGQGRKRCEGLLRPRKPKHTTQVVLPNPPANGQRGLSGPPHAAPRGTLRGRGCLPPTAPKGTPWRQVKRDKHETREETWEEQTKGETHQTGWQDPGFSQRPQDSDRNLKPQLHLMPLEPLFWLWSPKQQKTLSQNGYG